MKLFTKISTLALFLALATSSCQECEKCQQCPQINTDSLTHRGGSSNLKLQLAAQLKDQTTQIKFAEKFKFDAKMLEGSSAAKLEKLFTKTSAQKEDQQADAALVSSIFSALMSAENKANSLDVFFSVSSEPAEDGFLVFGMRSETERELVLQMFNEATFEMVAANRLSIGKGNNYKALNVKEFDNGVYLIKIIDADNQAELIQRVEIANAKDMQ